MLGLSSGTTGKHPDADLEQQMLCIKSQFILEGILNYTKYVKTVQVSFIAVLDKHHYLIPATTSLLLILNEKIRNRK